MFFAAVMMLAALTACNSVENRTEAYNKKIDQITADYLTKSTRMEIAGASREELDATYSDACSQIKELCLKTIRKNRNNSLAVEALKNSFFLFEKDELDAIISSLGDEVREDEFVRQVMSGEEPQF